MKLSGFNLTRSPRADGVESLRLTMTLTAIEKSDAVESVAISVFMHNENWELIDMQAKALNAAATKLREYADVMEKLSKEKTRTPEPKP